MGTKLSELIEATTVAISDIFHLRTSGGIDKKITPLNFIKTVPSHLLTTKGDLLVRGTTEAERIVAGAYGTKLTAQGAGELPIFEPVSRIRVTKNNAQSINTGTVTIVQYDDEEYDNLGEFASYRFTAQKTGYYLVTASLQYINTSFVDNYYLDIRIFKNNLIHSYGDRKRYWYSSDMNVTLKVTDIIYLDATNYIDIRTYHSIGVTRITSTSAKHNYFAVHRLS